MPVSVKNNLPGMGFNSDLDQLQTSQMAPPASQQPLREHFEFDHDSEEDAPPNRFSSRQTHHHQHTASSSRIGEHGSPKSNPLEDAAPGGVIIHSAGEGNKSRWSHIDDLDSFFIRVYNYHQKHGFKVMVLEETFQLLQFGFIVLFAVYLYECVDYAILFKNELPPGYKIGDKITWDEILVPVGSCAAHFGFLTWLSLLIAALFWMVKAFATVYHVVNYWEIKSFYNSALKIPDDQLDSVTWKEVQKRLSNAQEEHLMCIHKKQLTELDIYHRILRFKNYQVAMINKDLLPVKINVPFVGEKIMFSHGLKYNLEFLFFKGPWAPFNQWHLKDDYKRTNKKQELIERMQDKIALLALINLVFCPFVLVWQILYCFFNYAELIKREPGWLGVRKWSLYGRFYLRHFNELDHELTGRLNRAYKPAIKYMELFPSPIMVVIAKNVTFCAGAILGTLLGLTVWDEDVLNVEHSLTAMTVLTGIVIAGRVFIPDENLVLRHESMLSSVVAHTHYFPTSWKGQAHNPKTMDELGEIFPYTAVYLLHELISPITTPFILYFSLRPKAHQLVDFFRNFTVDVVGVGDVCSFAQMDVRKHGNPDWQASVIVSSPENKAPCKGDFYSKAEGGKTELSLVHFTLTNPEWKPPTDAEGFISEFRALQARETEAMPTLSEEQLNENPMYQSLNSLDAAGGVYSSLAGSILQDARPNRYFPAGRSVFSSSINGSSNDQAGSSLSNAMASGSGLGASSNDDPSAALGGSQDGAAAAAVGNQGSMQAESQGFNPSSSTTYQSQRGGGAGADSFYTSQSPSMVNSRLVFGASASLSPPPNLRGDLRRLQGLEYTEADMSLSALYMHEKFHRMSTTSSMLRRNIAASSRYEFDQGGQQQQQQQRSRMVRRSSLNEMDEENIPLMVDADGGSGDRLSASDMA